MRVAVGMMAHESNSFNPETTGHRELSPLFGEEIWERKDAIRPGSFTGLLERLTESDPGIELIPTAAARALPGGLVGRKTYQEIRDGLLEQLHNEKVDGVCLALHGSMTVRGPLDAEGDLLERVRRAVGPGVPIVCALDMHAMVTPKMVANCDAFVGYRTAPHVDAAETGRKAADLLLLALEGEELVMDAVGLPLLVCGEQTETEKEPMQTLLAELDRCERDPDVLSTSYLLGFPWVDAGYNLASAVAVTRGRKGLARKAAAELAASFWQHHRDFDFTTPAYPLDEALSRAARAEGRVFLADAGDNPGAGAAEKNTFALRTMLARGVKGALFAAVFAPRAVRRCRSLAPGDGIRVTLDGSDADDDPLTIEGRIVARGNASGIEGTCIAVKGIDILLTDSRVVLSDPEFLRQMGVEPRDYRLLVMKSGYLDPRFKPLIDCEMLALTPGHTCLEFETLDYNRLPRPIYPLDEVNWRAEDYYLTDICSREG